MPLSNIGGVERRGAKLQAADLRLIQIWVHDTRTLGFAEECRRQSGLIRASETAATRAEDAAWEAASWASITHHPG